MKKFLVIAFVLVLGAVVFPTEASADWWDTGEAGCGSQFYVCDDGVWGDPDAVFGAATTITKCQDDWGCTNCVLDVTETYPICAKVRAMPGYCTCKAKHVGAYDNGQMRAVCEHTGICSSR